MTQKMTRERMGEIALKVLKRETNEKGMNLGSDVKRKIGNMSKEIGITTAEGMVFAEAVVREMVDEAFISKK